MKIKILSSVFFLVFSSALAAQDDKAALEERYYNINKNLNIFNSIVRELDMLYVDSLDMDKTIRTGIDYMLHSLDPYTVYYNEEDMKELTFMTTGEYAGVGSSVVYKDGKVVFTEPFEGKPAALAGVKAGDIILEIDGKDMTTCQQEEGMTYGQSLSSFVSNNLKGDPGTTIEVKVEREGEKKPLKLKIKRENIVVDPVVYTDILNDSIGYVKLDRFTSKSSNDLNKIFRELKDKGITAFILDLRDNGGGVMEDAVQIVNMFVPKGQNILTTRGRTKQSERIYKTTLEPLDIDMPMAVLINGSTASASEIVAGSIQDLDRGVLIGTRSYGKGLVQVPREIVFGGGVKITTSKYYIPSGRCVQVLDYKHKNADGTATQVADSLRTTFYTSIGREVKDGAGVSPDILTVEAKTPNITYYLSNQFIIFDWVTKWVHKHKTIDDPKTFSISNEDYADFVEYVKSKDFEYDKLSEKSMSKLKEVMEFEGYYAVAEEEFKALEAKLVPDLERDLELFKPDIMRFLNAEIVKRYYYQRGEIAVELKYDTDVNEAIRILSNKKAYEEILSVTKQQNEADSVDDTNLASN